MREPELPGVPCVLAIAAALLLLACGVIRMTVYTMTGF